MQIPKVTQKNILLKKHSNWCKSAMSKACNFICVNAQISNSEVKIAAYQASCAQNMNCRNTKRSKNEQGHFLLFKDSIT